MPSENRFRTNAGTGVDGPRVGPEEDRRTGRLLDIGADEYHMDPFFIPLAVKRYTP